MPIDAFMNRWDKIENKAQYAWRVLDAHLHLDSTIFDDWLYRYLGETALVELARQHIPEHEPSQHFTFGQVSRVYNLPVKDRGGCIGIGNPDTTLLTIVQRYNPEAVTPPFWEPLQNNGGLEIVSTMGQRVL